MKQRAAGSTPALATTEIFAAIVEPARRLVANEEIAGAEPAGRSRNSLRRVGQKETGPLIGGKQWSVTTHADHTVAEGKEWSRLAVTQALAGATPVSHPPSRAERSEARAKEPSEAPDRRREGGPSPRRATEGKPSSSAPSAARQARRRAIPLTRLSGLKGRQRPACLGCRSRGVQVA